MIAETDTSRRNRRIIHRTALTTAAFALLLIAIGGLVTSRDAGLSVPDWPLAYGQLNPPHWWQIENVRTEHGHRIVAFCVACLTAWLGWIIYHKEPRPWVRRLGAAAAALVLLQALLGGLRVLALSLDLAMIHGWLGQMYFATLAALATVTSPLWMESESAAGFELGKRSAGLTGLLSLFVVFQLVLGIIIRHLGGDARPLLSNPVFHLHVALALSICWLALETRSEVLASTAPTPLRSRANVLLALLLLQMALGLASLAVTEYMVYDRQATFLESWLPTAHVATGAAMLGVSISLCLYAWQGQKKARADIGRTPVKAS